MSGLYSSQAVIDVLNERERQIQIKGWTNEHDDAYEKNELTRAASGYVNHVVGRSWTYNKERPETYRDEEVPEFWPWAGNFWKPKSPREDLVRAAAILIAEIERLDREVKAESEEV
ncbi:hypothetical protein [Acinetobacter seifertii]|uniref:hypothetical protein n=1 Tax=Acinetobacter seifertii TaxID=1530123 RepID=UPI000C22C648|nr:hypothetical protein [Acinetobacter seifertii]PJG67788.1 hypothetical protein CVD09_03545 [Acinetobacter seifertii]